jgi:hypothetical protein
MTKTYLMMAALIAIVGLVKIYEQVGLYDPHNGVRHLGSKLF